jgi:general secretion pathway protein J
MRFPGKTRRHAARSRGLTLLEVMVAFVVLAGIALLIYGAFDSLSRGRKAETARVERARQARNAVTRIARELSSAYLSLHRPFNQSIATRITAFIGDGRSNFDRVDFTAFAHRRTERDSKESDQAEVGYLVVRDPAVDGKMDLVRREQSPPDLYPKKGGIINVLAENVEAFELKYKDPMTGMWTETWDSTQINGQPNRLPLEISITLTMKALPSTPALTYTTKVMMPMLQPFNFGNIQ